MLSGLPGLNAQPNGLVAADFSQANGILSEYEKGLQVAQHSVVLAGVTDEAQVLIAALGDGSANTAATDSTSATTAEADLSSNGKDVTLLASAVKGAKSYGPQIARVGLKGLVKILHHVSAQVHVNIVSAPQAMANLAVKATEDLSLDGTSLWQMADAVDGAVLVSAHADTSSTRSYRALPALIARLTRTLRTVGEAPLGAAHNWRVFCHNGPRNPAPEQVIACSAVSPTIGGGWLLVRVTPDDETLQVITGGSGLWTCSSLTRMEMYAIVRELGAHTTCFASHGLQEQLLTALRALSHTHTHSHVMSALVIPCHTGYAGVGSLVPPPSKVEIDVPPAIASALTAYGASTLGNRAPNLIALAPLNEPCSAFFGGDGSGSLTIGRPSSVVLVDASQAFSTSSTWYVFCGLFPRSMSRKIGYFPGFPCAGSLTRHDLLSARSPYTLYIAPIASKRPSFVAFRQQPGTCIAAVGCIPLSRTALQLEIFDPRGYRFGVLTASCTSAIGDANLCNEIVRNMAMRYIGPQAIVLP
ncbi:MAG: hypothetical protein ACYCR4_10015, partial [Acidimicrobiales bacterium]